jgi:formate C-acetyltransferase
LFLKIVGIQTDKPLKRAFMPYGGIRMAEESLERYGYTPNPKYTEIFSTVVTNNSSTTISIRKSSNNLSTTCRTNFWCVNIEYLMQEKLKDHANCGHGQFTEEDIRLREEISDQYKALKRINVETRPIDIAAPFCSLIAAK